jgi:hypothetical protein
LATRKLQRHSKLSLGSFVSGGTPDQSFCRQGCEEPRERADKNRRAKPVEMPVNRPNTIVNNSVSTNANAATTAMDERPPVAAGPGGQHRATNSRWRKHHSDYKCRPKQRSFIRRLVVWRLATNAPGDAEAEMMSQLGVKNAVGSAFGQHDRGLATLSLANR